MSVKVSLPSNQDSWAGPGMSACSFRPRVQIGRRPRRRVNVSLHGLIQYCEFNLETLLESQAGYEKNHRDIKDYGPKSGGDIYKHVLMAFCDTPAP